MCVLERVTAVLLKKSVSVTLAETPQVLDAVCINLPAEQELTKSFSQSVFNKYQGQIVNQCDSNGALWYVDPATHNRYYLPVSQEAYDILRQFALGITNADLNKIPLV